MKKRDLQTLPNKESQQKAIAEDIRSFGIFSELVIKDNFYISQNKIRALPINHPTLPIRILLFTPMQKDLTIPEKYLIDIVKNNFSTFHN